MLIYHPSQTRNRLVRDLHHPAPESGLGLLDRAYRLVTDTEPLAKRLRDIRKTPREALDAGVLSDADFARLQEVEEAVRRVVAVDDYTPEELANLFPDMRRSSDWGGNKEAAE